VAMWLSMGPIADRTNDRLGASDLAIVEFRKQMLEAVRSVEAGEPAIGTGDAAIPASICASQAVIPKTIDWRGHEARYIWLDGVGHSVEMELSYVLAMHVA